MIINNRKTVFFGECFTHKGKSLQIQSNEKMGVYCEILTKVIEQLDLTIKIHKRVLVLRFDLHLNYYTKDNKLLSTFMNRIKQGISRKYGIKNIGSIWVRELERAKTQHYHLALFLDGNKIQHPKQLNAIIGKKWQPRGHMPTISKPFYYIDSSNLTTERANAIYRLSYLAKTRGKGYRDPQAKDFQASRLNSQYNEG